MIIRKMTSNSAKYLLAFEKYINLSQNRFIHFTKKLKLNNDV